MNHRRKRAILKSLCKQFKCNVIECGMYNTVYSDLLENKHKIRVYGLMLVARESKYPKAIFVDSERYPFIKDLQVNTNDFVIFAQKENE